MDEFDVELFDLDPIGDLDDAFDVSAPMEPEGPVCVNCGGHDHPGAPGTMPAPNPRPQHSVTPAYGSDVPIGTYGAGANQAVTRKDVGLAALGLFALGGFAALVRALMRPR